MQHRQRWKFLLAVLLVLSLILAACGSAGKSDSGSQASSGSGSSGSSGTGSGSNSGTASSSGGSKNAQGVTDTEILIGNWQTLSGPSANLGTTTIKGVEAYFKYINDQGGVNGRKLKLVNYDDEYQPSKTVSVVKKLIEEDKVFALSSVGCTSCTIAALPHVIESGIPLVGITSGADNFVNPVIPNVFGLITNYRIEGKIFARFAVEQLNGERIAIFYQNDDFGKSGYSAALEELEKYNISPVAEVPYNATDVDFSSPALKIKEANPDVILSFSIPKQTAAVKMELAKLGVNVPFVVAGVAGSDNNMFSLAGDAWTNIYSSNWMKLYDNNEKVQKYVSFMQEHYPDVDPYGLAAYGWGISEVLVEGIRRAGDDLSWENFIRQLETLKDWDGGISLNVTYTPDSHYGTTSLIMIKDENGKLVQASDELKYDQE